MCHLFWKMCKIYLPSNIHFGTLLSIYLLHIWKTNQACRTEWTIQFHHGTFRVEKHIHFISAKSTRFPTSFFNGWKWFLNQPFHPIETTTNFQWHPCLRFQVNLPFRSSDVFSCDGTFQRDFGGRSNPGDLVQNLGSILAEWLKYVWRHKLLAAIFKKWLYTYIICIISLHHTLYIWYFHLVYKYNDSVANW